MLIGNEKSEHKDKHKQELIIKQRKNRKVNEKSGIAKRKKM